MEIWKDVEGYEGILQVSNLGRVRTLDHYVRHKKPEHKKLIKGKIHKTIVGNSGYEYFMFTHNGISKHMQIHRLVAKAFIPNPGMKLQVNHIDCNKLNNKAENLEWCTASENMKHAYLNKRIPLDKIGHYGTTNASARPVDAYTLDGKFLKHFDTMKDAAKEYGIPLSGVCNCCTGYSKTCHGMVFVRSKSLP